MFALLFFCRLSAGYLVEFVIYWGDPGVFCLWRLSPKIRRFLGSHFGYDLAWYPEVICWVGIFFHFFRKVSHVKHSNHHACVVVVEQEDVAIQ